ncbi:MAG: transposase family protein [Chloroflexi bacterium]|nr:transposase family protein [Chloroflexota bacterium]
MVRCEASGAHCPKCGAWSEAFHGSYERNLGDLPIAGRQAVIDLRVRRFRCYWPECLGRPSSSKPLSWRNATLTEHADSGLCSKRSASLWAVGLAVATVND